MLTVVPWSMSTPRARLQMAIQAQGRLPPPLHQQAPHVRRHYLISPALMNQTWHSLLLPSSFPALNQWL